MDVDVWDRTMTVNLRGPMLGCKPRLPHMLAAPSLVIVTTSSTSGQFGDLPRVAYGVSKAGIDSLTRYVATLYGKQGIRCNAVTPGVVKTPSLTANVPTDQVALFERNHLTPNMGKPENIAEVVAFLLSDGRGVHHGAGRERRWRPDLSHTPLLELRRLTGEETR